VPADSWFVIVRGPFAPRFRTTIAQQTATQVLQLSPLGPGQGCCPCVPEVVAADVRVSYPIIALPYCVLLSQASSYILAANLGVLP
jgi:hypothetical protein